MNQRRYRALRLTILAALGVPAAACSGDTTVLEKYNPPTTMAPPPANPPESPCVGATLVLTSDGFYTGFARCPDGTLHRLEPTSCDATISGPSCQGDEESKFCESNADCTEGPYGRCIHQDFYGNLGVSACSCSYGCALDSDCAADEVCVCKDVVSAGSRSTCEKANCAKSEDCPSGECGLSIYHDGCSQNLDLACRADSDACRLSPDCSGDYAECEATSSPHVWKCSVSMCVSGRPLIVDGGARTAPAARRDDWRAQDLTLDVGGLDPALRAALGEHYLRVAAMEHAAIASFARFTLELLALGAPAELIADTQRAALDEVEHARIAYAIAGVFAGREVGPGPLDMRGVHLHVDRDSVIAALIEEACVGETLAAAEVTALALDIVDPALRHAHERIAEDELRHAALGWRSLRWLLEGAGPEVHAHAARVFEQAIAAASVDPPEAAGVAPSWGLVGGRELGDIRRAALREIVEPCMRAVGGAAGALREDGTRVRSSTGAASTH